MTQSTNGQQKLGSRSLISYLGTVFVHLLYVLKSVIVGAKRRRLPLKFYAARHFDLKPEIMGVNLAGFIRAEMGLGEAARGMAMALEAAKIPFNIINLETSTSRQEDQSWIHKEAARSNYQFSILNVNPDSRLQLRTHVSSQVLAAPYVIGNWFWELSEFPEEWMQEFAFVNEVWAPSRFTQEAISFKSPVPVIRVPPVVQPELQPGFSRSDFELPERCCLFLVVFAMRSVMERKNPLGAIQAFKKAFPDKESSVGLVVKINNSDYQPAELRKLKDEIGQQNNITIIDRDMRRAELNALIWLSDCFVSLHRSEGFGLGPAEAMSFGKPVIATNWSGNTDYMTAENSIGIDYTLVKLEKDYGPYKLPQHWAEPDIDQAAYWMKRIVQEPELARAIGARGQETIRAEFSAEAIGRRIRQRLEYIVLNA
jgi:glycosyltransferase involved in cell wall biosynthesis